MTTEQKLAAIKKITEAKDKADRLTQMLELQPDAFTILIGEEKVELPAINKDLIKSTVYENLKAESRKLLDEATELMK